jgi:hypothetical protein
MSIVVVLWLGNSALHLKGGKKFQGMFKGLQQNLHQDTEENLKIPA